MDSTKVTAASRRRLEFGHFSNVRLCLPNANELVALKKLYEMMRIPKSRSDSVTVARGFSPDRSTQLGERSVNPEGIP